MADLIRLLYAEDNPQDADLTRAHFENHAPDFTLEIARTGEECLQAYRRGEHDVILLDYRLPDMDGIYVLKQLMHGGATAPIVMVTGLGDEELVVECLRIGASDYIPKSGEYLATLPAILRGLLTEQRQRHPLGIHQPPTRKQILYVERDDFMENPPKKFFRLSPGREVRLRCAYFLTCNDIVKNAVGEVVEVRCTYDPGTRGGDAPDGRRVKATLHWVSADHAVPVEVRLYDRLFKVEDPERAEGVEGRTFLDHLNPDSLQVLRGCLAEPGLASAAVSFHFQFERLGYFCVDPDSKPGALVFNRTVSLRDTWARIQKQDA